MKTLHDFDFNTIESTKDRKAKAACLYKVTGQAGKAFDQFVKSSIRFFYGDGAKQINIINELLRIAHQSRGMNAARLGSYLKVVVPHEFTEGTNDKPPVFGKRDKEQEYSNDYVLDTHLLTSWFQYGKPPKSTDFDLDKLADMVARKLVANDAGVADFIAKVAEKEAEKRANKKAA